MEEPYAAPAHHGGNWHLMPGWRSSSPFQGQRVDWREEECKNPVKCQKGCTVGRYDEGSEVAGESTLMVYVKGVILATFFLQYHRLVTREEEEKKIENKIKVKLRRQTKKDKQTNKRSNCSIHCATLPATDSCHGR